MVADTFSNTLGVLLMGTGNDNNTWGTNCNTEVFQIFEDSIANVFSSSATSGTVDLSTPAPPSGPSPARFWQLRFNGSLTGNLTVKVPALTKEWFFFNNCTLNGFVLQLQVPGGPLTTVPQGWVRIWCDGSNVNFWPQGQLQNQMYAPIAGAPSYSSILETNSGFYRHGTQDWRIMVNGTDAIQFTGAAGSPPFQVNVMNGWGLGIGGITGGVVPSGAEMPFAGIFPPSGWYWEDGTAYSRTTDATLFNAITFASTGNTHSNTTIDNLPFFPVNLGLEGALIEGTGIATGTFVVSTSWNGSTGAVVVSQSVSGTNTGVTIRFLPWGQGDGSTTFNVPDRRGRTLAGRDNMNFNPANRLTADTPQGIFGSSLNAVGGEQSHVLGIGQIPAHNHSASDAGHSHADGGHGHSDAGHGHGINDTGHVHPAASGQFIVSGGSGVQIGGSGLSAQSNTGSAGTGISIQTGFANIQTGFANIQTGFANISIGNAGGGNSHNNVQPTGITNIIIKR